MGGFSIAAVKFDTSLTFGDKVSLRHLIQGILLLLSLDKGEVKSY